ncbi:hypothetical protein [Gluconacetobacter takamatsuzukensis]|uniref:Uncharacterized protein n=1 Tax=Gluconacetobacter takamatsuzukensis TaxID=1286190 RepID=A0A7W4KAX2_9PROT|nr:hypothetical protein [Gluconacetobacter takamatsuzukensis]MBB2203540.1 hypothetical protein [Gluconacetobacter takamatsuzukensis]
MRDLTDIEILSHLTALRAQVSGLCSALQMPRTTQEPPPARKAADGEIVAVTLNDSVLRRVADWQARQADLPNRAIALERMIEAFLDLDAWSRRPGLNGAGSEGAGA